MNLGLHFSSNIASREKVTSSQCGLPPLSGRLLSLLAIVQGVILSTLAFESAVGIFGFDHEGASFAFMFLLIRVEGICGGLT